MGKRLCSPANLPKQAGGVHVRVTANGRYLPSTPVKALTGYAVIRSGSRLPP